MAHIARRIGQAVLVLFITFTVAFLLLSALPSDGVMARFGDQGVEGLDPLLRLGRIPLQRPGGVGVLIVDRHRNIASLVARQQRLTLLRRIDAPGGASDPSASSQPRRYASRAGL